ncbi:MAG: hypothetical protein GY772_12625 [bacterium]|nr:hypothetical protein [bacterium]
MQLHPNGWVIEDRQASVDAWARVCEIRQRFLQQAWDALTADEKQARGLAPSQAEPPKDMELPGHMVGYAFQALEDIAACDLKAGIARRSQAARSQFKAWCRHRYGDKRTMAWVLRHGHLHHALESLEAARARRAAENEALKRRWPSLPPDAPELRRPAPKYAATDRAPDALAREGAERRRMLREAWNIRWHQKFAEEAYAQCARCGWHWQCITCACCRQQVCTWGCQYRYEFPGVAASHSGRRYLLCTACEAVRGSGPLAPEPQVPRQVVPPHGRACQVSAPRRDPQTRTAFDPLSLHSAHAACCFFPWVGQGFGGSALQAFYLAHRTCPGTATELCTRCNRALCPTHRTPEPPWVCLDCPAEGRITGVSLAVRGWGWYANVPGQTNLFARATHLPNVF